MRTVQRKAEPNRERRRAEIEQRLLEATERLTSAGLSFSDISVDQLAAEVGVSRATLYVYFEDKGKLLVRLTRNVFADLTDAARIWWDAAEPRDAEEAHISLTEMIAAYRRHQSLITAVVEMAEYDADVSEAYQSFMTGLITMATAFIERGADARETEPLAVQETAAALTWMFERTCHQVVRFMPPEQDDRMVDALLDICWRTLYLRPVGTGDAAARETDRTAATGNRIKARKSAGPRAKTTPTVR